MSQAAFIAVADDATDSTCGGKRIQWEGSNIYAVTWTEPTGGDSTPGEPDHKGQAREITFQNKWGVGYVGFDVSVDDSPRDAGADKGNGKDLNIIAHVWTLTVQGTAETTSLNFDNSGPSDYSSECQDNIATLTWAKSGTGGGLHLKPKVVVPKGVKDVVKDTVSSTSSSYTVPIKVKYNNCSGDGTITVTLNFTTVDIPQVTSWTFTCDGSGTGGTLTPNYGTPITVIKTVSLA